MPADEVTGYLEKLHKVEDLLSHSLEQAVPGSTPSAARINWLMATLCALAMAGSAAGCIWLWRLAQRPVQLPPLSPEDQSYTGLGGWLVLVGISLSISPLLQVGFLASNWESYSSADVWQMVAMPNGGKYHPLYGPLLMFELLTNVLFLGVNILLLFLFFGKRHFFCRVYVTYLVAHAVFLWIDDTAGKFIPSLEDKASIPGKEAIRATFHAVIWGSYIASSKRVRATFREKRPLAMPPPLELDARGGIPIPGDGSVGDSVA